MITLMTVLISCPCSTRWLVVKQVWRIFELTAVYLSIFIFICQVESPFCSLGMLLDIDNLRQFLQGNDTILVEIVIFKFLWEWFLLHGCVLWYLASTPAAQLARSKTDYVLRCLYAHNSAVQLTTLNETHRAQNHKSQKRNFGSGRHLLMR